MASTYSNLKIQLMATGENSGTWGNVTNTNLGTAIEEAIAGSADVTFSSGNVTLTLTDTNASQTARNMRLNLTGTTGGARDLIVPAIEKMYVVNNGCADAVTVKVSGQTGVAVPAGKSMVLFNNGTDVVNTLTHTPVSSGGTGAYSLTANNVILGNGTSAVQFVAPGTAGNVLSSNGTIWASTSLGLGTMSTQNANSVAITGGTITGTTVNSVTVGSNASGAKTISTASPTGGSSGDVWYRVAS